jgi:transposase
MSSSPSASSCEEVAIKYVCGIDIGSQSCAGCICRPDKSLVVKHTAFANRKEGWNVLLDKLSHLDALPGEILIGMEATARYSENLYHALEQRGYQLCLLHPGQTHQFHQRQGLRAKTDRLDAVTIARVLLSGEARAGYIPNELIATYRELVRLHSQLSEQAARYQNQIHALVVVLFPEFTQVFADPCLSSALAVLQAYPSAQAMAHAGEKALYALLHAQKHAHYGHPTAKKLLSLAATSVSSGRAEAGRSVSLRIVCEQLEQTQKNLERLQGELEHLLANDPAVKALQQIPEFGTKTVAVLRAELGDVDRFGRTDQVIAYAGLDVEIKESGLWKGQAKLSKRGSGLLRQTLYLAALRSIHLEGSAFGAYYRRLVERGLKKGSALMAVMRKMLAVTVYLLKHEQQDYDPSKVGVGMLAV